MELIKKNIHMDRIKCRAATQITLEDDRNVPDQKPDMERLILQRGSVVVDEIKPTEDHVNVKGKLEFRILYMAQDGGANRMEGQLPFEEQVYMDGVTGTLGIRLLLEGETAGAAFLVALDGQGAVTGYAGLQVVLDEGYILNVAYLPSGRSSISSSLMSGIR